MTKTAAEYTAKWRAKQRVMSGKELVTCQVCGKQFFMINTHHLKKHGLTINEYKILFPQSPVQSKDSINERKQTKSNNLYQELQIPSDTQSILIGSMLGDGYLDKKSSSSNARYRETARNEKYIKWKMFFLEKCFNVKFTSGDYLSKQTGKTYYRCRLSTNYHPFLNDLHSKWYPNGKKIVCRDDVENYLDDLALAVWFYDDGHIQRNKSKSHPSFEAHLYPLCFSKDDVKYLVNILMSRFDIKCWPKKSGNGYLIYIPREGRDRLIEIISKYPASGMEYKINNIPQPKYL